MKFSRRHTYLLFSIVAFISVVGLTCIFSCDGVSEDGEQGETPTPIPTLTPTPIPTLTPTPTPTPSTPPAPPIPPIPTPDLTTNWKEFGNEELGYIVKYPPDFEIRELISPARIFENPGLISFVSLSGQSDLPGKYTIMVFDNVDHLSVIDWINENKKGYYRDDLIITDIMICNLVGKQFASIKGAKLGIYFLKDDRIYAIEWHSYINMEEERLQFELLVSSFNCI